VQDGGPITVNLYGIPGVTTGASGTYTLLTAADSQTTGLNNLDTGNYTLGNVVYNNTNFKVAPGAITSDPNDIFVTISSAAPLTGAFWKGGFTGGPNVWAISDGNANSNWTSDAAGLNVVGLVPGPTTAVTIAASGASNLTNMVLGASMTIGSLTITSANPVTLNADGNTLTIANNGSIVVNTAAAVTLNAALSGINVSLTQMGAGTLTLGGSASLTGPTMVSNGTLNVNGGLTTQSVTVASGAKLGGWGSLNIMTTSLASVQVAGTIRGGVSDGTNNWGTLTIGTTSSLASTLQSGGTLQTEVSWTGVNAANASLLKWSVGGTINLVNGFNISLLNSGTNDVPVTAGTYTINLMQVGSSGNILLNGAPQGASAPISSADYTLSSPTLTFSSHSLALDPTGMLLQLTFTVGAVPEPEHILLLCVGVLLVGIAIRRRWRRHGSAASVA
jgi:hypothetical protein